LAQYEILTCHIWSHFRTWTCWWWNTPPWWQTAEVTIIVLCSFCNSWFFYVQTSHKNIFKKWDTKP
jgi:hypothetical protein